jgi:hypothetical protein
LTIEYLLEENQILKQQFESTAKKLRLNNYHRRNLAKRGKDIGWTQMQKHTTLVRLAKNCTVATMCGKLLEEGVSGKVQFSNGSGNKRHQT